MTPHVGKIVVMELEQEVNGWHSHTILFDIVLLIEGLYKQ